MIAARSASPRFWLGLLLTGVLHVAIIWMFAQHRQQDNASREARVAIQWLLPMRQPMTPVPSRPLVQRSASRVRPSKPAATKITPVPAAEPQAITPPADVPDPFAMPAPAPAPSAADIMAQARKDVSKIDQELRKAHPERGLSPPNDSKQATLERGINAAHEAVPPKWYEPAKTVEISPPNAHTRMYRVTTALITYCISISEDGRKSYTNCPR